MEGQLLVLEYFDTPGQAPEDRYREAVSRESLKRHDLSPESRVFWQDKNMFWRSGRILETNEHGDICIRGHDWEGFVAEPELYVRWDRPLDDPVGFADSGLLESPQLAELRRPFLQSVLRQRSASHGMSAVLSSCIELHEHQVETAWRVLQDPVQRYLLADEVGLGKTIEAGLVIRQLLLDNPKLHVQLILPPFLIEQWKRELTSKFRIQDFPKSKLQFVRNDEPDTWEPADLIVIDEAHHLARLSDSFEQALAERYAKLESVALASPALLMLSATPALHNEQAFLAMLKLLDPAVYRYATVEELRVRLQTRAALGRTFLGLQPGLPGVLVKSRLAEIATQFPEDPEVKSLTQSGFAAIEKKDDRTLVEVTLALRAHVSEVYRVHRRMLRTRRTIALERTFQVTGRKDSTILSLDSKLHVDITKALDQWREQILAAVEGSEDGLREAGQSLATATALSLDPVGLQDWARERVAFNNDEQEALNRIISDLAYTDRRNSVSRPIAESLSYIFGARERVVVFCPTPELAAEIAEELRRILPDISVLEHLSTDPAAVTDNAVRKFEATRNACVLVADSTAEEGRNLQFVDLLIHVGVPAGANRLEQRIGRCDRWNPNPDSTPWRSFMVREDGDTDSYAGSWDRILRDGFGVYIGSIASLQHAVENATDSVWKLLLERGTDATEQAIELVREMLLAEVEHVREQDALDSLETVPDGRSLFKRLQDVESETPEFSRLTHNLVANTGLPGNLRFEPVGHPDSSVGGYEVVSRLPGKQAQIPLIPAWRLRRDFLPLQGHKGTFVRAVATSQTDTHLYRYGEQFIDAVSDFLSHDDRGRAYGMWRWAPTWARTETPCYRFDYAVEANPLMVVGQHDPRRKLEEFTPTTSMGSRSVRRRADGIFPPLIVTVWIDEAAQPLTNPIHLQTLALPYRKPSSSTTGGDFALNRVRMERAYAVVPSNVWASKWRAAEEAAQRLVNDSNQTVAAIAQGIAVAERDATIRLGQLKLRAGRSSGAERQVLEQEIHREEIIAGAMEYAITNPTLRLDSTGLVILSGRDLGRDQ